MTQFRCVVWLAIGCLLAPGQGVASGARELGMRVGPGVSVSAPEQRKGRREKVLPQGVVPVEGLRHPVLWVDPGAIGEKDLISGPGGEQAKPMPPFTFEQEDRSTKAPRLYAHDGNGKKWSVDLGQDARAEVAASRLLWAVGYLTDQDYAVWRAHVEGLRIRNQRRYEHRAPKRRWYRLKASEESAEALPYIEDARFALKVEGQRKVGVWDWRRNAFAGTKEMNGLRVMMALLNCWDLKDANNPVIEDGAAGREEFRVSGTAASFGKTGRGLFRRAAKGSAAEYARSRFITRKTAEYVDFATPARGYNPFSAVFRRGSSTSWVGRRVPTRDARWIGGLLGQLSHKQIEDAFWAAGYPATEVNAYADVVEGRIRALGDL